MSKIQCKTLVVYVDFKVIFNNCYGTSIILYEMSIIFYGISLNLYEMLLYFYEMTVNLYDFHLTGKIRSSQLEKPDPANSKKRPHIQQKSDPAQMGI